MSPMVISYLWFNSHFVGITDELTPIWATSVNHFMFWCPPLHGALINLYDHWFEARTREYHVVVVDVLLTNAINNSNPDDHSNEMNVSDEGFDLRVSSLINTDLSIWIHTTINLHIKLLINCFLVSTNFNRGLQFFDLQLRSTTSDHHKVELLTFFNL